jgi:hypothetical protein
MLLLEGKQVNYLFEYYELKEQLIIRITKIHRDVTFLHQSDFQIKLVCTTLNMFGGYLEAGSSLMIILRN